MDLTNAWWEAPLPDAPSARIIADSISATGHRITTFEMRFHRFVLAEMNTHTLFSRNSASSRAIPYQKQRERVLNQPAFPIKWPLEQPGMQGASEEVDAADCNVEWYTAIIESVKVADRLAELGLHKSVVNRLLEPYMYHTATITAVDWEGFFRQRSWNHTQLAQPEIAIVATIVEDLYRASSPELVDDGGWHLPYVRPNEMTDLPLDQLRQLSVARCARTSYLTHDGERDLDADFKLYNRLASAEPPHASPFQHVATPAAWNEYRAVIDPTEYGIAGEKVEMDVPIVGNTRGWMQLRHIVMGF